MPAENMDSLNVEIAAAIRYVCYGNIVAFWRRHQKELDMCYATFLKAMRAQPIRKESVQKILSFTNDLGLAYGRNGIETEEVLTRTRRKS